MLRLLFLSSLNVKINDVLIDARGMLKVSGSISLKFFILNSISDFSQIEFSLNKIEG